MTGIDVGSGITSSSKIIANVFISFIGAGLLGLPYAFKEAGILEGAVVMMIVGYLSVAAMLMIIDCKYAIMASIKGGKSIALESRIPLMDSESSDDDESMPKNKLRPHDLTYGDIGLYAYGKLGKRLVDITIVISQIGFCCGYLIYLCENLKRYLSGFSQGQWLMILLPPIYGLTLLRHLNKLAVFSLFAQVSNIFALAVVFWFDFSHTEEVAFPVKEISLKGLPFFFAVAIYCYEGAGMILSLEDSVAASRKSRFKTIFVLTMLVLTLLYITFGASGYLSFGPHTRQIITLNLPHGKSKIDFAALVKVCLGVSFFFTYPLMLFPVTHLIDKTFGFSKDKVKGNLMRLVIVLITGLVVIAIPNFAVLAGLIGATCCTLLAFIMPAAFHLNVFKNRLTRKQLYFDILLIALGVLGAIVGLYDTVHRIASHSRVPNELNNPSIPIFNSTISNLNFSVHSLNSSRVKLSENKLVNPTVSYSYLDLVNDNLDKSSSKFGSLNESDAKVDLLDRSGRLDNFGSSKFHDLESSNLLNASAISSNSKPGQKNAVTFLTTSNVKNGESLITDRNSNSTKMNDNSENVLKNDKNSENLMKGDRNSENLVDKNLIITKSKISNSETSVVNNSRTNNLEKESAASVKKEPVTQISQRPEPTTSVLKM